MAGAGQRLGPDDIGVSQVGRKSLTQGALAPSPRPLDTGLLHCHLLGQSPCQARRQGVPRRVWVDRSRGRYEPGPPRGVTRRWECRWNLPQCRARHDSAAEPARGTAVTPGVGCGVLLGNQAELARPGDDFGAVGGGELAQQVADVLLRGIDGEPISRSWVTVRGSSQRSPLVSWNRLTRSALSAVFARCRSRLRPCEPATPRHRPGRSRSGIRRAPCAAAGHGPPGRPGHCLRCAQAWPCSGQVPVSSADLLALTCGVLCRGAGVAPSSPAGLSCGGRGWLWPAGGQGDRSADPQRQWNPPVSAAPGVWPSPARVLKFAVATVAAIAMPIAPPSCWGAGQSRGEPGLLASHTRQEAIEMGTKPRPCRPSAAKNGPARPLCMLRRFPASPVAALWEVVIRPTAAIHRPGVHMPSP